MSAATPSSVELSVNQKQGDPRDATGESLAREAQKLLVIAQGWSEAKSLKGAFLICLCQLTLADPAKGVIGFSAEEVREGMEAAYRKNWAILDKDDPEALGRRVRKELWRGGWKLWEQKREGVLQKLLDQGAASYLDLDRVEGGGWGNPTRYRLLLRSFAEKDTAASIDQASNKGEALGPGEIRYTLEDLIRPNWFARWLGNSERPNWQANVFIIVMVAIIIGLTLFSVIAFIVVFLGVKTAFEAAKLTLASIAIVWLSWCEVGPLVNVGERRILLAPDWMQPMNPGERNLLLEWRSGGKDRGHCTKVVRYGSLCSICGGKVRVSGGGLRLPGRLMGKCENSPREHVFTFDHITRKGKVLP